MPERIARLIVFIVCLTLAAVTGAASAASPATLQLELLAALGIAGVLLMIQSPAWAFALFWIGYSLKSTVFAGGSEAAGIFYPLYGVMLLNSALFLCRRVSNPLRTRSLLIFLTAAGLFLAIAAFALGRPDTNSEDYPFVAYQRLFIYFMGAIGAIQFWADARSRIFLTTVSGASLALAVWVVVTAQGSGFQYRGGTGINENYLAEIVAVGLLPIFAATLAERTRIGLRIALSATLLIGVYALLLLASRGTSIAFAASALLALALQIRRLSVFAIAAMVAGAAVLVLPQLPGSESIILRFHSSDVYTLNDRTAIWSAVSTAILDGNFGQLLFGHGVNSAVTLVRNQFPEYTSTHNSYLQILYEFGVLGVAAFLSCHLVPLFRLMRRRDATSVASAAMLVFLMLSSLTGTESDNFQYWLVVAFAAATSCRPTPEAKLFRARIVASDACIRPSIA
jgi:O-antigen ligase